MKRRRKCDNPPPEKGAKNCVGMAAQNKVRGEKARVSLTKLEKERARGDIIPTVLH